MNLLRKRRSSFDQLGVCVVMHSGSLMSFEHDFGMDTCLKVTRNIFGRHFMNRWTCFPCQMK